MTRISMNPLDLAKLTALMDRTRGDPGVKIGLIDGPVFTQHPDLDGEHLCGIPGGNGVTCAVSDSTACLHGTFIAGMLSARRGSRAPAICPGCSLIVRPIFSEGALGREQMPTAAPRELAQAIVECIEAGARIINLSLSLGQPSTKGERELEAALDRTVKRGVIVVAAAGNQGTVGSSAIVRHPWVIPVVACNPEGRPTNESNLSISIGRRGLSAPGHDIDSLGADGRVLTLGGTSVAVPFVTGALALLCSEFPSATTAQVKHALADARPSRRASIAPPLLDAAAAFRVLMATNARTCMA